MSYRVISQFGLEEIAETGSKMLCDQSGGRWDAGIGGCICPSDRVFDPLVRGCVKEQDLSYAAKREAEARAAGGGSGGAMARGDIPEWEMTEEEAKRLSDRISLQTMVFGGLAFVAIGGGIAYALFGGTRPRFKPEFDWEE